MYLTTPLMGHHDCEACLSELYTELLLNATGNLYYYDLVYDGMICAGVCEENPNNVCPVSSMYRDV